MNNPHGIQGVDGHTPVFEPNSPWKIWAYHEVYFGQEGYKKYVPKVNDLVHDIETQRWWRVVAIDASTMIPRLISHTMSTQVDLDGEGDELLGAGLHSYGESFRLYINKAVLPHKCVVDQRCFAGALHARYAKVYRPGTAGQPLEVISMLYNASNQFLTNEVPLAKVAATRYSNTSIKTVEPFRTTFDLKNGDKLLLVYHGAEGEVLYTRDLLVQETGVFPGEASDLRYVTHISLESPYMLENEPGVIEYPINLLVNSLIATGVVHYSDGSTTRLPAQGGQFTILGLNDYVSSIPNHEIPISLRYTLLPNEITYGSAMGDERTIVQSYTLRTGQAKAAYSVKLYCYPVWVDALNGYRLEFFLINLERRTVYPVTQYVRQNLDTTAAFNPILYGVTQRLSFTINLGDVASYYIDYNHVQVFDLVLVSQGTETRTKWTVTDHGATVPYGVEIAAHYEFINQNLKVLDLSLGETDYSEWLERLYWNTRPLYDRFSEVRAPEPNYIIAEHPSAGILFEAPITDWRQPHNISATLEAHSTMYIRFVYRTADNDVNLSIAGLPVQPT